MNVHSIGATCSRARSFNPLLGGVLIQTGDGSQVTCPECIEHMAAPPDPLAVARELVTLRLLDAAGDDLSYDRRLVEVSKSASWFIKELLEALVEGLAATWESADDFSAHVIQALTDGGAA